MDGRSVPSQQLYQRLGSASAPLLVDVRCDVFGADDVMIVGAMRGSARDFTWALANFPDDHEMLTHGMVIYDALCTWCPRQSVVARAR